jgi:hypothetical protein
MALKNYDDKDLVILVTLLIVIAAMVVPGVTESALQLAEKSLYGLFGLAVGKALGSPDTPK